MQHVFFRCDRVKHCDLTVFFDQNVIQCIIRIISCKVCDLLDRFSCIGFVFLCMERACIDLVKTCQFHDIFEFIRWCFEDFCQMFTVCSVLQSPDDFIRTAFLAFRWKHMHELCGTCQIRIQVKIKLHTLCPRLCKKPEGFFTFRSPVFLSDAFHMTDVQRYMKCLCCMEDFFL